MTKYTRRRANPLSAVLLVAATICFAQTASATVVLDLPSGSRGTTERTETLDSYRVPTGPYTAGALPAETVEGQVSQQAFRVTGAGITTLQLLAPLREQMTNQGYEILLDCADVDCGGFDFRFAADVLPGPYMYVDLTDFRFLSATTPDRSEYVTVLVSRSAAAGFVQITRVAQPGSQQLKPIGTNASRPETPKTVAATSPTATVLPADIAAPLDSLGHVILPDLTFDSGSSALGPDTFISLETLADYLRAHPDLRVALVGHTDATGSLDANIALSRKRAASVKDRLVRAYDIASGRLDAEGMGYLAPIASNLTQTGRDANRRVEAVLLPN